MQNCIDHLCYFVCSVFFPSIIFQIIIPEIAKLKKKCYIDLLELTIYCTYKSYFSLFLVPLFTLDFHNQIFYFKQFNCCILYFYRKGHHLFRNLQRCSWSGESLFFKYNLPIAILFPLFFFFKQVFISNTNTVINGIYCYF